jgi:hypothetical protein
VRYRLDFVGSSVDEVVLTAGGWLVDQVWAGWDVTVLVSGDDDIRPLQILGVGTADREAAMLMWNQRGHPHALAVSADLLVADARVRESVRSTAEQASIQVTLWGERRPDESGYVVDTAQYELSSAAVVFKAQALTAAGLPGPVGPVESFGRWSLSSRSATANVLSLCRIRHH